MARQRKGNYGQRRTRAANSWRPTTLPNERKLYAGADHGAPVTLNPLDFAGPQRDKGWGAFAEPFLRLNEPAFRALDVEPVLTAVSGGAAIQLRPGGRAGAVPLRSAVSGKVTSGLVVRPRFGWAGIGHVLSEIGWHASPEFLSLPLVPGSGREVPPWVLAGPVLARFNALLSSIHRGYLLKNETLGTPRGRILWKEYCSESLTRGKWHHLPCQYPDLGFDPELRSYIRWGLERISRELQAVGKGDRLALALATEAARLIESLRDVHARLPSRERLDRISQTAGSFENRIPLGLEALAWVVEERGLGGGQEQNGLSWQLPLEQLWEQYVESIERNDARLRGGDVRVGRLRETIFPISWSSSTHKSLGHLVPDIVISRGSEIRIVDAKYKAHFAELDDAGWHRFTEDAREAHRADIHQILAYAALYDAKVVTAAVTYPLRPETWAALAQRGRDVSVAELLNKGRRLRLELRGIPFGDRRKESMGMVGGGMRKDVAS